MVTESPVQTETNNASNNNNSLDAASKQAVFDPNVKHPLLHTWTLWYDGMVPNRGEITTANWGDNIKEVFTVATIEDFWRLYNNITLPTQLQFGSSYNLFKDNIEPKWEHPANEKGGKWTIIIGKTKGLLDRYWLWLLLACVGEQLEDDENQICGAVVNVRKNQDKLSIWTKDADNKEAVMRIGRNIKRVLELPDNFPIGYQGHFQKNTRVNKYDL